MRQVFDAIVERRHVPRAELLRSGIATRIHWELKSGLPHPDWKPGDTVKNLPGEKLRPIAQTACSTTGRVLVGLLNRTGR
jgi:hypothetical protein